MPVLLWEPRVSDRADSWDLENTRANGTVIAGSEAVGMSNKKSHPQKRPAFDYSIRDGSA